MRCLPCAGRGSTSAPSRRSSSSTIRRRASDSRMRPSPSRPAFASMARSSSESRRMAPSRVALYGRFPFYRTILSPIRDLLGPGVESLLTGDAAAVVAFEPHVLVLAAHDRLEYFRHHLPATAIGNVRHGLVSKAVLSRTPRRAGARYYDFLCAGPDDTAPQL